MKAVICSLVCSAALVSTTLVAAQQSTTSDSSMDQRIEARILKDSSLKKDAINVDVSGGVVTLTGTVSSTSHRTRAETLAHVTGVTRVDNQIVVSTNSTGTKGTLERKYDQGVEKSKDAASKAGEKTREGLGKAGDATKEGVKTAVDKTKEGFKKVGSEVTDAWILSSIKTSFVNEDPLKGSDINVDVDSHVVTLKGTVASEAGRARAMELARKTDGVTRVVDRLVIAPKR